MKSIKTNNNLNEQVAKLDTNRYIFYGKYTFKSTNKSGDKKYLTSHSSRGQTYPYVSATTATETERWIVYQDTSSLDLIIQMDNLYYLSAVIKLDWVIGSDDASKAYPFKIVDQGNSQIVFQIYVNNQWQPISYSVNVLMPYLVIGSDSANLSTVDTYHNFLQQTITQSLADIQKTKNARNCDFQNVDLSQADLSRVDCTKANFSGATLSGTNFSDAILKGACFINATLDQTIFSGATILDNANFSKTNLSTVKWGVGISAKKTHFDGCTAINCQIGSSDPKNKANFSGANLSGADFSFSDFSNVSLNSANMIAGVFVGAIFQQTDLTSATLGGVEKTAAASLAFAYMPNVNFRKANLFGVNFVSATLFGGSTSISDAATIEQADFSNAYLEGISLNSTTLSGAKFNNSCLVNVDFTNAILSTTMAGSIASSLVGASLQGAIFVKANLANTDFSGASVSFGNGSINVRYCDPVTRSIFPPVPGEPLTYHRTNGLDLKTMTASTICPNGLTVHANKKNGNSLKQMLTVVSPTTSWGPVRCLFYSSTKRSRATATVLDTTDAVLKVFSLRHFRDFQRLVEDPEAKRYMFWNMSMSEERLKSMIHYYKLNYHQHGLSCWPVYRKRDNAFMGVCELAENPEVAGVEINIAVMPNFRGDPMIKDVCRAALQYGFIQLQLGFIYATVEVENCAAEKFVAKMGFQFVREVVSRGDVRSNVYKMTQTLLSK